LWSAILSIGYLFDVGPFPWTFFLGWAALTATGLAGAACFRALVPGASGWDLAAAGLLIFDWRLAWSAGSGMETLLFACLVLLVMAVIARRAANQDSPASIHAGYPTAISQVRTFWKSENTAWLGIGFLVGLSAWVRPDGLTLIGPAVFVLFTRPASWKVKGRLVLIMLAGICAASLPYLAFNQVVAGSAWPNTLYAKQAEYASHRQLPLLLRVGEQFALPLTGAGAVLAPGFLMFVFTSLREKRWIGLALAAWFTGFLFLYALRLPVTYQHGRYIMPALPIYLILGLAGLQQILRLRDPGMWRRVLSRAWLASLVLVEVIFWGLGAQTYGRDVALIESEMVDAARWIEENTPKEARIAAHDIGALGFFARRDLLDLAGLISPDVIPIIRDEPALSRYLESRQAAFLVTFPGWYPSLSGRKLPVYCSDGKVSPALGGENMCVYRWPVD
jgi:hypothetical protein